MKRLSSISLGICLLLALAAQASELRVLLNEKKVNAGTSWSDEGFQIQLAKLFAERSQRELKLVILSRKRLAMSCVYCEPKSRTRIVWCDTGCRNV